KDRLFLAVERKLRQKIYINPSKLKLLECLGFSKDEMQWFTVKEEESHIHIYCTLVDAFKFRTTENIANRCTVSYELNEFVQRVSPEVIIPSVYNDGPDSAAAMVSMLFT
ncbi:LOW QUALITY PROTEIN: hypothetical protein HID58_081371, partial [Brassica napus]